MPEADIREELHKLRRETLAALEEWDYEKAAGLVKAAGHLERIQDPGHRSTAEKLKHIKININYITYKRKERKPGRRSEGDKNRGREDAHHGIRPGSIPRYGGD